VSAEVGENEGSGQPQELYRLFIRYGPFGVRSPDCQLGLAHADNFFAEVGENEGSGQAQELYRLSFGA